MRVPQPTRNIHEAFGKRSGGLLVVAVGVMDLVEAARFQARAGARSDETYLQCLTTGDIAARAAQAKTRKYAKTAKSLKRRLKKQVDTFGDLFESSLAMVVGGAVGKGLSNGVRDIDNTEFTAPPNCHGVRLPHESKLVNQPQREDSGGKPYNPDRFEGYEGDESYDRFGSRTGVTELLGRPIIRFGGHIQFTRPMGDPVPSCVLQSHMFEQVPFNLEEQVGSRVPWDYYKTMPMTEQIIRAHSALTKVAYEDYMSELCWSNGAMGSKVPRNPGVFYQGSKMEMVMQSLLFNDRSEGFDIGKSLTHSFFRWEGLGQGPPIELTPMVQARHYRWEMLLRSLEREIDQLYTIPMRTNVSALISGLLNGDTGMGPSLAANGFPVSISILSKKSLFGAIGDLLSKEDQFIQKELRDICDAHLGSPAGWKTAKASSQKKMNWGDSAVNRIFRLRFDSHRRKWLEEKSRMIMEEVKRRIDPQENLSEYTSIFKRVSGVTQTSVEVTTYRKIRRYFIRLRLREKFREFMSEFIGELHKFEVSLSTDGAEWRAFNERICSATVQHSRVFSAVDTLELGDQLIRADTDPSWFAFKLLFNDIYARRGLVLGTKTVNSQPDPSKTFTVGKNPDKWCSEPKQEDPLLPTAASRNQNKEMKLLVLRRKHLSASKPTHDKENWQKYHIALHMKRCANPVDNGKVSVMAPLEAFVLDEMHGSGRMRSEMYGGVINMEIDKGSTWDEPLVRPVKLNKTEIERRIMEMNRKVIELAQQRKEFTIPSSFFAQDAHGSDSHHVHKTFLRSPKRDYWILSLQKLPGTPYDKGVNRDRKSNPVSKDIAERGIFSVFMWEAIGYSFRHCGQALLAR